MENEEIKKSITLIFNRLESIESKLDKQEEDIKTYTHQSRVNVSTSELIIARLKSTRTSFELLRNEIEELHELTVALFNEEYKGYEHEELIAETEE